MYVALSELIVCRYNFRPICSLYVCGVQWIAWSISQSRMTCVADALFLSNFERNWLTMVMEENLSAKIAFSLLSIMRKLSLVNETLRPETETRPRRLTFSPRRDRDRDVQTFHRDRDETETLGKCVSRPSRDRDVETETTSLTLTQAHNDFCFNHAI